MDSASGTTQRNFLLAPQVSEYLGVPETRLKEWRMKLFGPPFYRFGRQVRYDTTDLETWLDTCKVETRPQLVDNPGEQIQEEVAA